MEILIKQITKNLYPQIGEKYSRENARTFLSALELHGIGKISDDKKRFMLNQNKNLNSPNKMKLFNRIGI